MGPRSSCRKNKRATRLVVVVASTVGVDMVSNHSSNMAFAVILLYSEFLEME